ncbi:MAG: TRAP transporter small permease [Casimicrobiaceae bacterium]
MASASSFAKVEHALARVDAVASTMAGATVIAVMLIVVVDVVRRYFFNAPLAWSYDIISLYLMLAAFYLALSETLRRHHHVAVDLLYERFGLRTKLAVRLVSWMLAVVFFALVFVLTANGAWIKWRGGDVVAGSIPWPTWLSSAIAALGSLLIAVRLAFVAVAMAAALVTGRADVAAVAGVAATREPDNL